MDIGSMPGNAGTPQADAEKPANFALDAAQASRLIPGHKCQPGDEYTATVTLKVAAAGDDGSVTFQVPAVADFAPAGAQVPEDAEKPAPEITPMADEDPESEKAFGYKRPKSKTTTIRAAGMTDF